MTRIVMCLASLAILLGGAAFSPGRAQVDFVIQRSDISMLKNSGTHTTYVTATVHNNGGVASGALTLRIGVSMAGSSATSDFTIASVPAGNSVTRTGSFTGTDWMCGWANADIGEGTPETSESNNFAGKNDCPTAILPGTMRNEWIGVVNPGLGTETVVLAASAPPDWIATVNPSVIALGPGELVDALVRIGAPAGFLDYARVDISGNFQDGTPGVMEWTFHMESSIPVGQDTWGAIKALFSD